MLGMAAGAEDIRWPGYAGKGRIAGTTGLAAT